MTETESTTILLLFAVLFVIWVSVPSVSPIVTQLRRIAEALEEANREKERARRESLVLLRPPAR